MANQSIKAAFERSKATEFIKSLGNLAYMVGAK